VAVTDSLLLIRLEWAQAYREFYEKRPARFAYWDKIVTDLERMIKDENQLGRNHHRYGLPGVWPSRHGGGAPGR